MMWLCQIILPNFIRSLVPGIHLTLNRDLKRLGNFWIYTCFLAITVNYPLKLMTPTVCCKIVGKKYTRGIFSQPLDGVRPPFFF